MPNPRLYRTHRTLLYGPVRVRALFACLLTLILGLACPPPARAEEAPRPADQIIAAIPSNAQPTYYRNPLTGEASGFAVDMANEVAKRAGLSISYVFANNWEEIQQMIVQGKADLVPGLSISPGRQKIYAFSQPFDTFTISFFVRAGSDNTKLRPGAEVGMIRGSVAHEILSLRSDLHPDPYETFEAGLFDLLSGKLDAFACPTPIFQRLAAESGVGSQIKTIKQPIAEVKRAFGVRKYRADLAQRLDTVLDTFVSSPDYQTLYRKWYGVPKPYLSLSKPTLMVSIALVLLTMALVLWRHLSLISLNNKLQDEIAARKKATLALTESESRYRELFEAESDAIFLIDNESGHIIEANNAATVMYGYDRAELLSKRNIDLSAEQEETQRRTQEAKENSNLFVTIPVRHHRKKSGTVFPVEITGRAFMLQGRSVHIAAIRDITERKQSEAKLIESEERFRKLLQHVPSVSVQGYGADGTVRYWNDASEKLYGFTAQEALGMNLLDLIIPPEMRSEVRQAVQQMTSSNQPIPSAELSLLHKDGSRVSVYSSHAVIHGPGGEPEMFCIDIDLSSIKKAAEQLKRSLREKEVLVKEIHHRVKNNMQVIYSLLNLQAKGIEDPKIRNMFEESRNRVNSMALIHEKLYQSKDLAHINFREYLQSLAQGISSTYNRPEIKVTVAMEDGIELDINIGIPCGLMVNELISNAFKHAFPNTQPGTIEIGLRREGTEFYVLTVTDNGIGFPAGLDFRNTPSLGLQLVNVLTGQVKGTVTMTTEQGTSFSIRFPARTEESAGHERRRSEIGHD